MKTIDKVSEVDDKLLDPRELSYRLGKDVRRRIAAVVNNDKLDSKARDELRDLVDKEEDSKQLLSYDTLAEIHKRLQRLDESYKSFFYQLLDQCKAVAPKGKNVR